MLESSLNRSFGDAPLEWKLNESSKPEINWSVTDSLLYHAKEHEDLWKKASPDTSAEEYWSWNEDRLQAFQDAVRLRTSCLYLKYFDACANLMIGD